MPYYYVNKNAQSDGYHEVHIDDNTCPTPPLSSNREPLGSHSSCSSAVNESKRNHYNKSDGCKNCIPTCHTR